MRLLIAFLLVFGSPAFAADPIRVGYAAQSIIFGGPIQAGIDHGYFADQGLSIMPTTFSGGAKLHAAMASGAEDIGIAAATDLALLVKGAPEKLVYGVVDAPYSVAVSAIDPAIRTGDDLKGRKVGVTTTGSYTYWFASQLPQFLHWSSGRAIPVSVGGSLSGQTAALVSGQIDAVVSDIALGLMLESEKRGRIVLNGADVVRDVPSSAVFVQGDFLRDHPDQVRRFVAGVRQSLDHIIAHHDDMIDLLMRNTGLDRAVMAREADIIAPGWSRDGRITPAQIAATALVIVQAGLLDELPDLTPYVVTDFMPK